MTPTGSGVILAHRLPDDPNERATISSLSRR
jgi:hypothetical protein